MKTLVLKSSPRKSGSTAALADQVVAGLKAAGEKDVVEFSLHDLALRPCQSCGACLKKGAQGCAIEDGYQEKIYPAFREADVVILSAPIYFWHLPVQAKTFLDRWLTVGTFDQEHVLARKRLVLLLAYSCEDPYGVDLVVRMFESICGCYGMGLDVVRYQSDVRHVREAPEKLAEAFALGTSLAGWAPPTLAVRCETCQTALADERALAVHRVQAADEDHMAWKRAHLSAVHALTNTDSLVEDALAVIRQAGAPIPA